MTYTLSVIKERTDEFYQYMVGKTYKIAEVIQENDKTVTVILEEVPENISRREIASSNRIKGDSNYLSEKERKEILQKRKSGYTYQKLSEEYGYTPQGIKRICDKGESGVKSSKKKPLSEKERKEILQKRKSGYTYQKLSEEYGYTPQGIKRICDKGTKMEAT